MQFSHMCQINLDNFVTCDYYDYMLNERLVT